MVIFLIKLIRRGFGFRTYTVFFVKGIAPGTPI